VAKKKKGARKAAPRTRKATRKRTAAPAARPHIAATLKGEVTWKRQPNQIVLTPLKAILDAHIQQLRKTTEPNDQVRATLDALTRTRAELGTICGDTMVVRTP
jgi:hypothetical protein